MRVFHGTPSIRSEIIEEENIIKATTDEIVIHNSEDKEMNTTRGYVYLTVDERSAKFFANSSLDRLNYKKTICEFICIYEFDINKNRLECDYDQCEVVEGFKVNNCPNINNKKNCNVDDCIKYIRAVRLNGDIELQANLYNKRVYKANDDKEYSYYWELKNTI